jgi:hypothetical protein
MSKKLPFNLSKQARRDPPTAFDPLSPLLKDPYRRNKGKPNSGDGDDLLRPGGVELSNQTPGGGGGWSQNKEWPSDRPMFDDPEGNPKRDTGTGISTDHGLDLHDDYEGQEGSSGSDAALGINETTKRQMDDTSRDRKPYNVNSVSGILKSIRPRLRNL